jgi:hypothetical protein
MFLGLPDPLVTGMDPHQNCHGSPTLLALKLLIKIKILTRDGSIQPFSSFS